MQCMKLKYLQFLKKFQIDETGETSTVDMNHENQERNPAYAYEHNFQLELKQELCKVFDLQMKVRFLP
jgi:hypothetical protein